MPKLVFNRCCCCIELRVGCLIIAYLRLVGEILMLIVGIVGLFTGAEIAFSDSEEEDTSADKHAGFSIWVVIQPIIVILLFAFTIVLLVGLHQNRRGHVKAYLIYAVISLVFSVVLLCVSFTGTVRPSDVIKDVIMIVLSVYFLLVIRSYYYKMDEPPTEEIVE